MLPFHELIEGIFLEAHIWCVIAIFMMVGTVRTIDVTFTAGIERTGEVWPGAKFPFFNSFRSMV